MSLTLIKNNNPLRVVHNVKATPEYAGLSIVHRRVNRGVIQLVTSI
jgi:hypothetical protein